MPNAMLKLYSTTVPYRAYKSAIHGFLYEAQVQFKEGTIASQ